MQKEVHVQPRSLNLPLHWLNYKFLLDNIFIIYKVFYKQFNDVEYLLCLAQHVFISSHKWKI